MMPSQTIVPVFDDAPSSLCLLFTVIYMLPFALSEASCQRAPDNISDQCTPSVRSHGYARKGMSQRLYRRMPGRAMKGALRRVRHKRRIQRCTTKGTPHRIRHEGYVTKGTNKGDATQVTQHAKNSSPHAIYRKGYATHDTS